MQTFAAIKMRDSSFALEKTVSAHFAAMVAKKYFTKEARRAATNLSQKKHREPKKAALAVRSKKWRETEHGEKSMHAYRRRPEIREKRRSRAWHGERGLSCSRLKYNR